MEQNYWKANRVGRPALNSRMVLNAILWILRNGARWRDLPSNYGHWNSIYHKFRLWCKLGIFEKILQLVNQDSEETTPIEIDSTWYIKVPVLHSKIKLSAHRVAVKIPKFTWKNETVKHSVDRRTSSLSEKAIELFERITLKGKTDRAFSSDKICEYIEKAGGQVCIPDKSNFKINHDFDKEMYNLRQIS